MNLRHTKNGAIFGATLDLRLTGLLVVSPNFHAPISVQCLSSLFLNALVDGASTTCCGKAFQQLITLVLKNDFRTVVEHRGTNNFFECPRKLWVSVASWKNIWLSIHSFPVSQPLNHNTYRGDTYTLEILAPETWTGFSNLMQVSDNRNFKTRLTNQTARFWSRASFACTYPAA